MVKSSFYSKGGVAPEDITTIQDYLDQTEALKDQTAAIYDDFDARYLGSKASAPSVDNDGNTLVEGALYWNSVEDAMYAWDGAAWVSLADILDTKVAAEAAQAAAELAETNAETAQAAAELAELNAETAQTAAELAETNAAASASSAATSASNAATSETNAAASETSAGISETNAAASEAAAGVSETNAAASETAAGISETNAATSETNAATSASNASTSASNAATSETNAASSASAASASASNAATSESNAAASASAASTSESNASASETNAATSETNAASSASAASTSASNAANSETNAATSETNAASSASAASTSASNASTSETNAANSASAASTSASNAATSETNAASSASAASGSASAAAASAAAAAASYDEFDDRYLGSKTTNPSVDNDGNALLTGAMYWNSVSNSLFIYDGSTWNAYSASGGAVDSVNSKVGVVVLDPDDLDDTSTTNKFTTSSDISKLAGIEASATANPNAIDNVVEDTTPQLGGNLDVNGQKITSASNGDIDIEPNGTGNVLLGNFKFDADQTIGAGQDDYVLTYDNASGLISLEEVVGGVESVNSQTGVVVLDADDIDDTSTTNKFTTATSVTAAGAVMDSELTSEASVKAIDQGLATTDSPSFAGLTVNSNPIASAGSLSHRNKIINGNFDIWQRGTSFSSVEYGADRWFNVPIGSSMTQSRQSFTLGQTDVPNEPEYFCRSTVTSSAGAGNVALLIHRIEDVRTLAGQTCTFSFWAKADASKNIAVELSQYFGTGGSPSSEVTGLGVTTCSLTTSWQKFTVTVSLPSISGKTLGTNNNDQLVTRFWFDAGSDWNSRTNSLGQQSGTFDIAQVQLEAGSTATPFEMRSIGQEFALCQRYFQKYTQPALRGLTTTSAALANRVGMQLPVVMRAVPTATVGALPVYDGLNVSSVSSVLSNLCTNTAAEFDLTVSPANLASYRPLVVYQSGTASLELDAEL